MKVDRHSKQAAARSRRRGPVMSIVAVSFGLVLLLAFAPARFAASADRGSGGTASSAANDRAAGDHDRVDRSAENDDAIDGRPDKEASAGSRGGRLSATDSDAGRAGRLVEQVLRRLAFGPPLAAKLRERVWAAGSEVVGVGTYEQAGRGTGKYHLQVSMHDGNAKHTLRQVSDGRLVWTRIRVGESITLKRVNLGKIDESTPGRRWNRADWARMVESGVDSGRPEAGVAGDGQVPQRLRVGGITEMLDLAQRDYALKLLRGKLEGRAVWILAGELRETSRAKILSQSGRREWPELCPSYIRVAVAATPDPETNFGLGLPLRFEYRGDPEARDEPADDSPTPAAGRPLISLVELHSIREIDAPPAGRFKYVHEDDEAHFIDETDRYTRGGDTRLARQPRRAERD